MYLLNNYTLIILIILAVVLSFIAGRYFRDFELKHDLESLKRYRNTYLFKSGWTDASEYYHLFSFDEGKSWYALDKNGATIIGPAEEIYPGIISILENENSLIKYPSKSDQTDNA